ncbi:hypothetical protein LTR56_004072 [Elasticomyces elasticus]|nr:hypothetical protein LTR56_004072 [Elasticomyces elasticus]KAK4928940.1 hypothetical protein LTR49_004441 [Elasticomyces elasticus]
MYHMLIMLGAYFVSRATATDVPTTTPSICGLITEGYDHYPANLPITPILYKPPPPPSEAQGLVYSNLNVDEISERANIKPPSGNNVVAAAFVKTIGDVPGVSAVASGTIAISSDLKSLVSFDSKSFYFACVLSVGTAVAVQAVPCTIEVSSPELKDVVTYTIETSKLLLSKQNPMAKAVLPPSFGGVKTVTISIKSLLNKPLGAGILLMDDVEHKNNCV